MICIFSMCVFFSVRNRVHSNPSFLSARVPVFGTQRSPAPLGCIIQNLHICHSGIGLCPQAGHPILPSLLISSNVLTRHTLKRKEKEPPNNPGGSSASISSYGKMGLIKEKMIAIMPTQKNMVFAVLLA